jgi:hypothetical protein
MPAILRHLLSREVPLGYIVTFQCRLATGFEPLGCKPNAQTLCIAVSLETLVFSETPTDLLVENPESRTTFLKGREIVVDTCLLRKDFVPRGGFEPPTVRLTATLVISHRGQSPLLDRMDRKSDWELLGISF